MTLRSRPRAVSTSAGQLGRTVLDRMLIGIHRLWRTSTGITTHPLIFHFLVETLTVIGMAPGGYVHCQTPSGLPGAMNT
jgi:hypothetical protein